MRETRVDDHLRKLDRVQVDLVLPCEVLILLPRLAQRVVQRVGQGESRTEGPRTVVGSYDNVLNDVHEADLSINRQLADGVEHIVFQNDKKRLFLVAFRFMVRGWETH